MKLRLGIVALAVSAAAMAQSHLPFDGFDEFVERTLKEQSVPGASVVVVDRKGVVLSKGYGLRDVKAHLPVTAKTVFPLASATKSFTALGLAALIDKGRLDWDTPIRNYLPGLRLFDSYATDNVTLRDLLSHRSGLPRYEGVWVGAAFSQQETVRRLQFLEPSAAFRSEFQYSNMNFAIAAYLQGQADSGRGWEESERHRVIEPLGMGSTSFTQRALEQNDDHSSSYAEAGSGLVEAPFMNFAPVAGAGALNSNAEDMAHYLEMLVNHGKFGSRQIVSEKRIKELLTPVMALPWDVDNPIVGQTTYGLGWFLTTYRGHRLAFHWGSAIGFSTIVAFLPDDGYGVAVLVNRGGSKVPDLVSYAVWDRVLKAPPEDWAARFRLHVNAPPPADSAKPLGKRSHPLASYVGVYEHPGYGAITIAEQGDQLTAAFNNYKLLLKPSAYDVFTTSHQDFNALSDQNLQFRLDVEGDIDALLWDVEAGVPRGVFIRRKP